MNNVNDKLWHDLCNKHNCLLVDVFDAINYNRLSDVEYVANLKQRFDNVNMSFIELYEQSVDQNIG